MRATLNYKFSRLSPNLITRRKKYQEVIRCKKKIKKAAPECGAAFSLFENVLSENDLIKFSVLFGDDFKFEFDNHFAVKFHFSDVFTNFFNRIFLNHNLFAINFKAFFF